MTHLIHCINKRLGFVPSQTPNNIGCFPTREYCIDKGCEFILRAGTTDQTLQGSFIRIENEGWSRDERRGSGVLGKTEVLIEELVRDLGIRFVELSVIFTPRQYTLRFTNRKH